MSRTILHLDLDAFFCAVEEQRDPSLRGKAFAVGGTPEVRGVVASCSYAARRFGVHSAMPMSQAVRICPGLLVVPSRHSDYRAMSAEVMARLHELTPQIEQLSIDEAFLDVTDLGRSGELLARELQTRIRQELALPCSLGVASNKLVAKIATDVGKAAARSNPTGTTASGPQAAFVVHHTGNATGSPNAICVVAPGAEADFLAPLPASALWGIGPKTSERLAKMSIHTIGDLAQQSADSLGRLFGKHGHDLARRARGIDDRPVVTSREAKSVSKETTFARDINAADELRATITRLAAGVGERLRRAGLKGTSVSIKLRWADFTTITRQSTLRQPTDQDELIRLAATQLFERSWNEGEWVRLLGVGVSGLGPQPHQLSLWDAPSVPHYDLEQQRKLRAAVQSLRARFGDDIVRWGGEDDSADRL